MPEPPALDAMQALLSAAGGVLRARESGASRQGASLDSATDSMYRTLVEQIDAILFMARLDEGIGEAFVSPRITEAVGFTREEWLDDPLRWYETIHPEDRDRWSREAAHMISSGEPLRSTYRVVARDRSVRWFRCDARLLCNDEGKPWYLHGVAFDVTEQKQAEQQFRSFLESAPDAIVIVRRDGSIARVNSLAETMFQYPREELVGRSVDTLVPDRFRDVHSKMRDKYAQSARARPMGAAGSDFWGVRRDGTEFPVEISLSPIETPEGTVYSAAVRDVSERHQAAERLRSSLREKEALLHEVHHRVKNNLAVISSMFYLQAVRNDDETIKSVLEESQQRVQAMALVHETLYSAGDVARVDLVLYASTLANHLVQAHAVPEREIAVSVEMSPIVVDPAKAVPCGLILNEMVTNAIRHGFAGRSAGRLLVSGGIDEDGGCRISLQDDGKGLPSGFDPGGTESLGMFLMHTLARQLEGSLQIEALDPGVRVTLTFPAESGAS